MVFLSYKSEDCHAVRMVAEWLAFNDIPTWFAEYEILLAERGLDDIEWAIGQAVKRCSVAVVFTNDLYAGSAWCSLEVSAILEHLAPEDILEVCIPHESGPRGRFPGLAAVEQVVFDDRHQVDIDRLEECFRAKGWLRGQRLVGLEPLPPAPEQYLELREYGRRVDVRGWEPLPQLHPLEHYYLRRMPEPVELCVWITTLPYGHVGLARGAGPIDDRRVFGEMIRLSLDWRRKLLVEGVARMEPLGVHLFHLGAVSHYAISYKLSGFQGRSYLAMSHEAMLRDVVCRKYVITVEPVDGDGLAEIALIFRTFGDAMTLHRLSPLFEHTAASLLTEGDLQADGACRGGARLTPPAPPYAVFGGQRAQRRGCLIEPIVRLLGLR